MVELGSATVTPKELLKLKVGDTLMLGNDVSDPLKVKIEGTTKFNGFSGVSRGMKAIQITEVLEREG